MTYMITAMHHVGCMAALKLTGFRGRIPSRREGEKRVRTRTQGGFACRIRWF